MKNKRDYFKAKNNGTCYDLTRCISEYTGIKEKTVKRAIETLREKNLIQTIRKGKVNHFIFPVLDAIENNTPMENIIPCNEETPVVNKSKGRKIKDIIKEYNSTEEQNNNNEIINDNMGNYVGSIKYTEEQKEEIIKKVIEKNTPTPVPTENIQPPTISWEDYKKEYGYTIQTIINGFNSPLSICKKQAQENLKSLLNRKDSKNYIERIIHVIENNIKQNAVA